MSVATFRDATCKTRTIYDNIKLITEARDRHPWKLICHLQESEAGSQIQSQRTCYGCSSSGLQDRLPVAQLCLVFRGPAPTPPWLSCSDTTQVFVSTSAGVHDDI
ncbi:hypothetical protein ACU8KH_05182 [Lachancea thermotolerans]